MATNNTILTPQDIAREALFRLSGALNFGGLVFRDYSTEFAKKGDTVNVRVPATFQAKEFDGAVVVQDIAEDAVPVKMDIIGDITVAVSSKDLTLSLTDFGDRVLDGAVLGIRDLIDKKLSLLYKDIPYYTGTGGVTPNSLDAGFIDPRTKLNENLAPTSLRRAIFNPTAEGKLLGLDAIISADKSNSDMALREGYTGRVVGFDTFMNQNVATHTAGDYTLLEDATVTAGTAGENVISITSAAGTATTKLVKGDIFTVDGKQYTVTEDTANAVAGVIAAVKIYPVLHASVGDMLDVAVDFAGDHVANMAFHKNAFALVSRPLDKPMGGADSSYIMTAEDISVRVTMGYDMSKKENTVSIDCLFGVKTIQPKLATRILG